MKSPRGFRRSTLLSLLAAGVLAALAYSVLAAASSSATREEMDLNGRPVIVQYSASASQQELMLPFYPEAKIGSSFYYTVSTAAGAQVTHYASAILTAGDAPEKVAAFYRKELPGNPQAQEIEDGGGKRLVLAVADDEEVREVSISARESGSRIELTRAARPVVPSHPLRPRRPGEIPV